MRPRRAAERGSARRSGSRSARRPCSGCRTRGRARGRSLRRAIGADAADEHLVGLRRVLRRRDVDDAAPTARAPRSAVACFGVSGRSSSIQTASACPTSTGTRTVVALIGRSGSSRILRVSARSFDSSSVSSPSQLQSIARLCSAGVLGAQLLHAAARPRRRPTGTSTRARARGPPPRAAASGRR